MALTGACVALDGLTGGVAPTDDGGTPEEAARRSTHRTTPGRKTQLQRRRAVDGDDGTHRLRRVPSKIADVARFPQSRCSVKFPAGRRSTMTNQVPAVSGYVRTARIRSSPTSTPHSLRRRYPAARRCRYLVRTNPSPSLSLPFRRQGRGDRRSHFGAQVHHRRATSCRAAMP